MTSSRRGLLAALIAIAAAATALRVSSQGQANIGGYQLVSEVRVTRTISEFTYHATLTNGPVAIPGATATAHSVSPATVLVDDSLTFGPAAAGQAIVSSDTFTFRHNRSVPFDWANITWTIEPSAGSNQRPVANAGDDDRTFVLQTAHLDGRASADPEGAPLTYAWSVVTRPPGSTATLADATSATPSFLVDRPGTYVVQLLVHDGVNQSDVDTVTITTENRAPVANAGPDQTVALASLVTLNGSASSDLDGDALAHTWTVVSRPASSQAVLSNPTSANPSFTLDVAGSYTIRLVVNDGALDSAPDTVVISTQNSPPVANAGPDQTTSVGQTVTLNGSLSSDADGNPLSYVWSFVSRPPASSAVLVGPTTGDPRFAVDRPGTYVVQLVVNDGLTNSTPDTVTITTQNSPPVANAGANVTVLVNGTVTLDGSGSTDVDGDSLTYSWSLTTRPDGSGAVLSDPTLVSPTFIADRSGTYIAQLIVHDGTAASVPSTVSVTTGNTAPVAHAGPDQTALVGGLVLLDGSASSDVDGNPLSFAWSMIARPAGSTASLANATGAAPSFVVDRAGRYIVQLVVNDGTTDSVPDSVVIDTLNSAPIANAGPDQPAVTVGGVVTLDGSLSSDADGQPLTFTWSLLTRPQGSGATLADPTTVNPTFSADVSGQYVAQLIVNDGVVDSAPDTVLVTVAPAGQAPTANAGPDQTVARTATVLLDGSASIDPEGAALQFAWTLVSRPAGSTAALANPNTAFPTFVADVNGVYVAELVVNDGGLSSPPDTVTITVQNGTDLHIFFELPPAATPAVGGSISMQFRINNLGPSAVTGVTAHVPIPAGYTFNSSSLGTYDSATGVWSIPSISASGFARLAFSLAVRPTGPYNLTAAITGRSLPDPNPANDSATFVVTPNANADLHIFVELPPASTQVSPGSNVGLMFRVNNLGPAATSAVTAHVPIPDGFTFNSSSLGTYNSATGVWTIGSLGGSGFGRLSLNLAVRSTGSLTLTGTITGSSQPDPNPVNNTATAPHLNRPPVANAGADQAVTTGAQVTLNGTQSSDGDGDPLTFSWAFTQRPANSTATLVGLNTAGPTFVADKVGTYLVQLTATDSNGRSSTDAVGVSAIVLNNPPLIRSTPITAAAAGQLYRYDVRATDPDVGDVLTFSLSAAPAGMTIEAPTGTIQWTPAEADGGPQNVIVRVQDQAGLFGTQQFAVQVSTAANGAPVAVDDAFDVRVDQSLSVSAPGIIGNDTDAEGSRLTPTLLSQPANGSLIFGADGSFTYTPHALREGDLLQLEHVNLTTRVPGVTATGSSTWEGVPGSGLATSAIDGIIGSAWATGFGDSTPRLDIVFPASVTVTRLNLLGYRRDPNRHVSAGIFQLFDDAGAEVFNTGVIDIPPPLRDVVVEVPNVANIRQVRFTATAKPSGAAFSGFDAGVEELMVFGTVTLPRPAPFREPNLGLLLATDVRASSFSGFNRPEGAVDERAQSNWFASSFDPGEFLELVFPADVTVSRIQAEPAAMRPDGFGTSLLINQCSGSFRLFDASDNILFDSGVMNAPFQTSHPHGGGVFVIHVVEVPNVTGVRRVRYTSAGCVGGNFPPGFDELKVFGTASLTTPAFSMVRKFNTLPGREIHSTPLVANFTDDNLDGRIDLNDIPDIVAVMESTGNQLTGEIKVLSGDDGREVRTMGAPNLVSPWSDAALGDIDGDGLPEVVAVHTDGQHLIAFEHTGEVKWTSAANAMPRFTLGSSTLVTGTVAIANLDASGPPEIIVGASVFDNTGRLIGDGRTLGGTTAGNGLRSAISAVADLDLDGVAELVAGPTAYRLVNGVLSVSWQRSDRADGYVAIANLDDDPQPEIVVVANGVVYALNHDGTDAQGWNTPVQLPGGGQGGAPTVADLDGDGRPEIGVAGQVYYTVFNRNGAVRWKSVVTDRSSHATGATVFDFDGDGSVEVVYRDELFLRVYRGTDGILLARVPISSATWSEQPIVADVDNDGHADLVVVGDPQGGSDSQTGVHVFEDFANRWARTRRIWNQHSYHVTNVNENGSIPLVETANWLTSGLNNYRLNAFEGGGGSDGADRFTYHVADGTLTSNIATVRIQVRTPNSAPAITSTPVTSAASGVTYVYAAQGSDPDPSDILTYSLPTAAGGMTIDSSTGVIRWTPQAADLGTHAVVVRVEDVRGLFAVQGYTVTVASPLAVPDVVGQPQASAVTMIGGAGLAVGAVTTRHTTATSAGSVVSQSPSAGALAAPGALVDLVVSLGPPPLGTVPNLVGLTQIAAQADIAAAGLVIGAASTRHDPVVAAGIVLTQSPAAGTTVPGGSAVNLVVSLGRPPADLDFDGDGFTLAQGDCNDSNPSIRPGALDPPGDDIDQNCNGADSIAGDVLPPTAGLASPAADSIITTSTDIRGSATDTNFLRYSLDIAPADGAIVTNIGSGTTPVVDGVLGRLDPTLLENGLYRVRLTTEDVNGQVSTSEQTYQIDGLAKIGNVRLSFVDVSIPVAGIPITVVRTYDSRVKSREDFGIGWTLDLKRGTYQHNRTPGAGWQILHGGLGFPCQVVSQTASHVTTVKLSDFETYTFALALSNVAALSGGCTATAGFRFVTGRRPDATLEILDGTDVLYLNGDSSIVDPTTLTTYNPSRVRLTTADGRKVDFERGAGITRVEDEHGNALTITSAGIVHSSGKSVAFTRDTEGRIVRIIDPRGAAVTYEYNGQGDLVTVVDQAGNPTTFNYDTRHNLLDITDALNRRPLRNEYDADGRLIAVVDGNGSRTLLTHDLASRQETVTDQLGNITVLEYDDRGNVIRRTDPLGHVSTSTYDGRDNKLSDTDALGHTRHYTYDDSGNPLSATDALGHTSTYTYNRRNELLAESDALGGVVTLVYDLDGNLIREVDRAGGTVTFAYDESGHRTSMTNERGQTSTYAYDAAGNEIRVTDPLGNVTVRTYDGNGNLTTDTTSRVVNGQLETLTRTYQYDAMNRVIRETDPEGAVTLTTYTAAGTISGVTTPRGLTTAFAYDDQNQVIATTYPDGLRDAFAYDAVGRMASVTDRAGRVTTFSYDAAGRRVRITNPDGSQRQFTYDAAGRAAGEVDERGGVVGHQYDAAGRLVATTDQLGNGMSYTRDPLGRIITSTDANGRQTQFSYDAVGRLVRTTFADGTSTSSAYDAGGNVTSETDAAGNVTQFVYDGRDDLLQVIDAAGQITRYTYDEQRNRVSDTDALSNVTRHGYDRAGRPVSKRLPLGQIERITYDVAGNLTSVTDFNGAVLTYAYDTMNRVMRRTLSTGDTLDYAYTPTGQIAALADARGTIAMAYDLRDRPVSVQQPDGTMIGYGYDATGNRTSITTPGGTTRYTYDAANRLVAVEDPGGRRTTFGFDAAGNRTTTTLGNGVVASQAYDDQNRSLSFTYTRNAATLASFALTRGPAGQVTRVVENNGRQVDYSYDALFRLTQERVTPAGGGAPGTIAMTYDAVGNRLTKTDIGGSVGYTYDGNNRLTRVGPMTFGYDGNGNTVSQNASGIDTTYQFDALNRLTQVHTASTVLADFTYDAFDNRVGRSDATGSVAYLVDPFGANALAQVVRETDGGGGATDFVLAGDMLVSQQRGADLSFYLTDAQRSVRRLTDGSGAITDGYDFDAFGNLMARTGTTPNGYLYSGQQFDLSTGLYYLRARHYAPRTGRFMSVDPLPGVTHSPVTMHPYSYAGADPVNRHDPSGRSLLLFETIGQGVRSAIPALGNAILRVAVNKARQQASKVLGRRLVEQAIEAAAREATEEAAQAVARRILINGIKKYVKSDRAKCWAATILTEVLERALYTTAATIVGSETGSTTNANTGKPRSGRGANVGVGEALDQRIKRLLLQRVFGGVRQTMCRGVPDLDIPDVPSLPGV